MQTFKTASRFLSALVLTWLAIGHQPLFAQSTIERGTDQLPEDLGTRSEGEDWPSFLGPQGDNSSIEKGILTEWPDAGPRVVWSVETGTGYGACSIARGRCFIFDRDGDNARLRCLQSETGESIWTYSYKSNYKDSYGFDNGPRTSPVVDDDHVYIYGAEGQLHCVRVDDGKLIWSVNTSNEFGVVQNFFGVGSTPVVEGDNLLVMVGGSPPEDQSIPPRQLDRVSADNSCLVAFDRKSGKVRYKIGDDLASYASIRMTSIGDRRVALTFARSGLLGSDAKDGSVLFQFPYRAKRLETVNAASPVVRGDEVLLTESYELGACKIKVSVGNSPQVLWRDKPRSRDRILASHWMTPTLVDGYLYGCSGESNGDAELRCVDWKTGEVAWSKEGLARHSALAVDRHVLVVNELGQIWLIKADPAEFNVVAEAANLGGEQALLKKPVWAAPVLSHGLLYLRGKGRLVCAELIPAK